MSTVFAPSPPHSDLAPIRGNHGLPVVGYTARYMRDPVTLRRGRHAEGLNTAIEAGLSDWRPRPDFRVYPATKTLTLRVE